MLSSNRHRKEVIIMSNPAETLPTTPTQPELEKTVEEEVETEEWDPEQLTLEQIASVKYEPLGGKG
jgi:hypothetical protein